MNFMCCTRQRRNGIPFTAVCRVHSFLTDTCNVGVLLLRFWRSPTKIEKKARTNE